MNYFFFLHYNTLSTIACLIMMCFVTCLAEKLKHMQVLPSLMKAIYEKQNFYVVLHIGP